MAIKSDELLRNSAISSSTKPSLKIKKKTKASKVVILDIPILDTVPEKKSKRIISKKKKDTSISSISVEQEKLNNVNVEKDEIQKTSNQETTIIKLPKENTIVSSKTNVVPLRKLASKKASKRTLHLNVMPKQPVKNEVENEKLNSVLELERRVIAEQAYKPKEVVINQNSTFFSEPTIFQQFDIAIDVDDDEPVIEEETIVEPETTIEDDSTPAIEDETIVESEIATEGDSTSAIEDETIVEPEIATEEDTTSAIEDETIVESEIATEGDSTSAIEDETIVEPEIATEEDTTSAIEDEIIDETFIETGIITEEEFDFIFEDNLEAEDELPNPDDEYDFISYEINEEALKPHVDYSEPEELPEDNSTDTTDVVEFIDITNENSEIEENIIIESEEVTPILSLQDEIIPLEEENNDTDNTLLDLNLNDTEEPELQIAADSIDVPQNNKESHEPIGKFFDSSIPSIEQQANAGNDSYFKKVKKSLFSSFSNVFKKFSYEETNLANAEIVDEIEKADSPVSPTSTISDIQEALANTSNVETPNITEMEVTASPNTLVIPVVDESILTDNQVESNDLYNNIITPESNPTSLDDDISLDDLDISNIDLEDFDLEDLEDLEDDEIKETLENDEADIPEETEIETWENNNKLIEESEEDIVPEEISKEEDDELSDEEVDKEIEKFLLEKSTDKEDTPKEDDEPFSIEAYFGIESTDKKEEIENDIDDLLEKELHRHILEENKTLTTALSAIESENKFLKENAVKHSNNITEQVPESQMESFSKLIETFNQTISTLSNRISELESGKNITESSDLLENNNISTEDVQNEDINLNDVGLEDLDLNDISIDDLELTQEDLQNLDTDVNGESEISQEDLDNINLDDFTLEELEALETSTSGESEDDKLLENLLLEKFTDEDGNIDEDMKNELLSEVLAESDEESLFDDLNKTEQDSNDPTSDFFKIIDSLSKTISELEEVPTPKNTATPKLAAKPASDKAINILINEDDIFSISILNETYEIVADFDGISVISENIHISTPKNNFYVQVGEKYIEIHNNKDFFVVNTNFEDIEFANAINNVTFAKKNNKIELNIKEAFKISSVHNKIELSMLNTSIANLAGASGSTSDSDKSVCDNKTLLISEETQKVYLPYDIKDVMKKLNESSDYQNIDEVIEKEYTLPLSTFKMPIISRFKEAYKFMREKEKSSVYAALDLAVELMFNSNLNPAVIRASKDLKELNIYLDCLYENEIEKFDCFKVVYKVLPKIQ